MIALPLAAAVGWVTLGLGGHTDAAGRMGLALGAAVFAHSRNPRRYAGLSPKPVIAVDG